MKKIILLLAFISIGCSNNDTPIENCKTITNKEIVYESIGGGNYVPNYYFYLEGIKTEVTKNDYDNYLEGQEYCK